MEISQHKLEISSQMAVKTSCWSLFGICLFLVQANMYLVSMDVKYCSQAPYHQR